MKMHYIHLGCGIANRIFAIMNALHRYDIESVHFIWEKLDDDDTQFHDLFSTPLNLKISNSNRFLSKTNLTNISIHKWITKQDLQGFNLHNKKIVKRSNTIACCTCGLPKCFPFFLKNLSPHTSILQSLVKLNQSMQSRRHLPALHIRNDPHYKNDAKIRIMHTKQKHIKFILTSHNFSYISFERQKDVTLYANMTRNAITQDVIRNTTRRVGNISRFSQSISAVYDIYALSFAKYIISTKKHSTFSLLSKCLHRYSLIL